MSNELFLGYVIGFIMAWKVLPALGDWMRKWWNK